MSKTQLFSTLLVVSSVLVVSGSRTDSFGIADSTKGGANCTVYLDPYTCPVTWESPNCDEVWVKVAGSWCWWYVYALPTEYPNCNEKQDPKTKKACGEMKNQDKKLEDCEPHYTCLPG